MTKDYCDVCGKETTGRTSAVIDGIADADAEGNGTITDHFAVCLGCFRKWKHAMLNLLPKKARK